MNGDARTNDSASAGDPLHRRTARLTWLYVSALTTVAVLSVLGQVLVQRSLHRQRGDSTVVNIAGRQRMLSQRLTKAALAWNHATNDGQRDERANEMAETLQLWQRSHIGLQQGDAQIQLAPLRSQIVTNQFAQLEPVFRKMVAAATKLPTADEQQQVELLRTLLEAEPQFLSAMNAIVFQLDREAQERVTTLQRIEWLLLSLTLLVLVVEGWVVFRPAVQNIRFAAAALVESQEQLRIAKEAAESANEQKTRFLATLSHELRNPLHALLGNLELIAETSLSAAQHERIVTIESSARTLLSLVNDLLDLACIQAGKLRVTPGPCDLVAIAKRCIAMVEPEAEQKGLRLSLQLLDEPLSIQADTLRVQQVLLNLLGNAIKFTADGWITLRVGCIDEQRAVRLEVIDTGPGIPAELQRSIFAPFMQADSTIGRDVAGVGLGLAISAGLVELMDGRIGVDSEPGRGSHFWFELPFSEVPAISTDEISTAITAIASKLSVLVAEDDVVNRRLLSDFLQVLGHDAILTADGREALHQFEQQRFDFVLLDWHMPELDGLALAREIRSWEVAKHLPRAPLIAVSAAGAIEDEGAAREAGINLILVKPLSLGQLREALAAFSTSKATSQLSAENQSEFRFAKSLARMQGKRDLFCDVATIFLDEVPSELQRLDTFAAESNFPALARSAHLLRGQAVNFDAAELVQATTELEHFATAREAQRCRESIERVKSSAAELQTELRDAMALVQTDAAPEIHFQI